MAIKSYNIGITRGLWHVDDFGAIARTISDNPTAAQRAANVIAINAAINTALIHGGEVRFGPGVYHTNATVGISVTVDTNAAIIIRGSGGFPSSMISCNSGSAPNFILHSTIPNLRSIYIEDMQFHGGLTALSMIYFCYSRFNRVWFWGAEEFAVQMAFCSENIFDNCYFTETAAFGSPDGTGDSIYSLASQFTITNTSFGEAGGGVVAHDSQVAISDSVFQASCYYRGSDYYAYWVGTTIAVGSNGQSLPQSTINVVATGGSPGFPSIFPGSASVPSLTTPDGYLFVATSTGTQIVRYTGTTGTTFTGCSGGTGTMSTGNRVTPCVTTRTTTVASGSHGAVLPQATINVVSTRDFPTSGTISVITFSGGVYTSQTVTYTNTTATTFTGCSGGTGTMFTSNLVTISTTTTIAAGSNTQSLPQATINVTSTANLPTFGTIFVLTSAGAQTVTYTGTTATTFTGCLGGTGTMSTGNTVILSLPVFGNFAAYWGLMGGDQFSCIVLANSPLYLSDCLLRIVKGGVTIDSTGPGNFINISGCQFASDGVAFTGMITIHRNLSSALGLMINSQFMWLGTSNGYFISSVQNGDDPNLTGASITAQISVASGATMTPINIPGGKNNLAMINRTNI